MVQAKKDYSFAEAASVLRELAGRMRAGDNLSGLEANYLDVLAASLNLRHDHGDPCDDLSCPCRAAEYEHIKQQGFSRL